MARQKKPKGKHNIINRKTKDMPKVPKEAPYTSTNQDHVGRSKQFNPLRPLAQVSPHKTGKNAGQPSQAGNSMTDAMRKAKGIGRPMGHFESKRLNPNNQKDKREIDRALNYMYTHQAKPGETNKWQSSGDRTASKAKYNENFNEIDWGDKKIEGGSEKSHKFKKKY